MTMHMQRADGVATFNLVEGDRGSIDLDDVRGHIHPSDHTIRLDMAAVPLMHSPLLAQLVELYKWASTRGLHLLLANLTEENRKILRVTRLDSMLCCAA